MWDLAAWAWNEFLDCNGDPGIRSLDDVDGERIFPLPPGAIPDDYEDEPDLADLAEFARGRKLEFDGLPHLQQAVEGLEEIRREDFECWLKAESLDGIIFPAAADVAPFDADFNADSNQRAKKNGVVYSNGNLVIRHLGIPTVTVPMGVMADIGMPVGLTFAGPAYEDANLLEMAAEFEMAYPARVPPPRTPEIPSDVIPPVGGLIEGDTLPPAGSCSDSESGTGIRPNSSPEIELDVEVSPMRDDGMVVLTVQIQVRATRLVESIEASVNGEQIELRRTGSESPARTIETGSEDRASIQIESWTGLVDLPATVHYAFHSTWRRPYGSLVTALIRDRSGSTVGEFLTIGGI